MRWLMIIFVVIGAVEIGLFIYTGYLIGPWWVVGIILLTSFIGLALARYQGSTTWQKAMTSIQSRQLPTDEILNGICILIGGILLLTPGFFTDAIGFLLVIPATRTPFKRLLEKLLKLLISRSTVIYRRW